MKNTEPQKDASRLFCPKMDCPARGKTEAGNLVSHGKKRERYKCKCTKSGSGGIMKEEMPSTVE
jgi:hypothetical protein